MRETQSAGYILQVQPWSDDNPDFVFTKLQYNNFEPPQNWPPWTRFFYRPGVSLLRISNTDVLVGQCLKGLKPPPSFPKPEHEHLLVEPKTSKWFDRDGSLLADNHDFAQRHFMVSRMRVFPLKTLMPPTQLVKKNRTFCPQLIDAERQWVHVDAEYLLHRALSEE